MILFDIDNWPFKLKNNVMYIVPKNSWIMENNIKYQYDGIILFLYNRLFTWPDWDDDALTHVPENNLLIRLVEESPGWCNEL